MKNVNVQSVNKALVLSIITVLAFILAMFGITYAFFNIVVSGNESASSIIINVADLGVVTFYDGDVIDEPNIYPMLPEERITKTFSIEATGNTVSIDYTIYLIVTTNTFIQQYEDEFTYTLSGEKTNVNGTVAPDADELVPATAGDHNIGEGILAANGDEHTYTFTIGLNEVGSNQNSNQSKSFVGRLAVESKKYTQDRSIWGE